MLDEVANGLSFYDYTFLHEVPRLHCALEDRLNREEGGTPGELASFLTMGSWIGGDRDGNPFVTADVMRGTLRLQSSRVLNFYLEQLHALGAELSVSTLMIGCSPALQALSDTSTDSSGSGTSMSETASRGLILHRKMPRMYSPNIGSASSSMLKTSTEGVMTAAKT